MLKYTVKHAEIHKILKSTNFPTHLYLLEDNCLNTWKWSGFVIVISLLLIGSMVMYNSSEPSDLEIQYPTIQNYESHDDS